MTEQICKKMENFRTRFSCGHPLSYCFRPTLKIELEKNFKKEKQGLKQEKKLLI